MVDTWYRSGNLTIFWIFARRSENDARPGREGRVTSDQTFLVGFFGTVTRSTYVVAGSSRYTCRLVVSLQEVFGLRRYRPTARPNSLFFFALFAGPGCLDSSPCSGSFEKTYSRLEAVGRIVRTMTETTNNVDHDLRALFLPYSYPYLSLILACL
jgi:hypothetical protein